jgi:hypothetical protein
VPVIRVAHAPAIGGRRVGAGTEEVGGEGVHLEHLAKDIGPLMR